MRCIPVHDLRFRRKVVKIHGFNFVALQCNKKKKLGFRKSSLSFNCNFTSHKLHDSCKAEKFFHHPSSSFHIKANKSPRHFTHKKCSVKRDSRKKKNSKKLAKKTNTRKLEQIRDGYRVREFWKIVQINLKYISESLKGATRRIWLNTSKEEKITELPCRFPVDHISNK